jgi:acetoin utilization protein AcuB
MADPEMSIIDAQHMMGANQIRHMPVVGSGKRLLGLLTRQTFLFDPRRLASLDMWEITRQLSGMTVADAMVKAEEVVTIDPDTPIEQAALTMAQKHIGCLPVVEDEVVVGMITETDLLAYLTEMMAVDVPGVRVTVRMPMAQGQLSKLVAAVARQGWGIESLGGTLAPKDPNYWDAVIKIRQPKDAVMAALSGIEGQEIIDVRET